MGSQVHIRKLTIGEDMAKVCVPIVGRTREEVLEQISEILKMGPDLIEWRCDLYQSVYEQEIEAMLIEIRESIGEIPLIFTFRSESEGGDKFISNQQYYDLNLAVAKTGMADLIDIEAHSKGNTVVELISDIHNAGTMVIASNHNFEMTPSQETIVNRLMYMEECGADICKIAVMPKNKRDVDTLIAASIEASEKMIAPIVTMSMGETGVITRVCTDITKSAITFAAGIKASAPGQIECKVLKELINMCKNIKLKQNLMLIGFMGTGKSTISSALTKVTGLEEVDMDQYIEQKENMTISEIFEKYGEDYFRDKETEALIEIQKSTGKIVSCGGGVVLRDENVRIMKENGIIVLLTATPEVIFERVKDNTDRPLLNQNMSVEYIESLMAKRKDDRYAQVADVVIDTNTSDRIRTCYDILKAVYKG